MKEKIKELLIKYKEFVLYSLFGVLTTVANAGTFLIVSHILGPEHHVLNNVLAWFAGVVVAFVTNKLWVFNSKSWKFKIVAKESFEFLSARIFSFVFETVGLVVLVKILDSVWGQLLTKLVLFVNDFPWENCVWGQLLLMKLVLSVNDFSWEESVWGQLLIKLVLSVVVVLMNYIFSKFVIFRKKNKDKSTK